MARMSKFHTNNVVTFRLSRRSREMYCGHARLCVCLCVCPRPHAHYCTDPDVTWGSGRGCPLVVPYWADLQVVHGVASLWQHYGNAWQSPAVIRQAHRTHAAHAHYACRRRLTPLAGDNIDVPASCVVPFRPYCGGVVTRTRNVSEYMLVLALCLVMIVFIVISSDVLLIATHRLNLRL